MNQNKMKIEPRARVAMALNHQSPDRPPLDLGSTLNTSITKIAYDRLKNHLGIALDTKPVFLSRSMQVVAVDDIVLERFQIDTRPVLAHPQDAAGPDLYREDSYIDEWGVKFRAARIDGKIMYYDPVEYPLSGMTTVASIEKYNWPDPYDSARTRGLRHQAKNLRETTAYAVVGHMGDTSIFQLCFDLRGMKQFLIDLLERKPRHLSGGQRQRVALGRAIVRKPDVFLYDEPLSNLDAKLRVQMRTELIKLHARLQSTSIYVTHDQVEAMTMGDRIVVMHDGLIQQVGSPMELYNKPANRFVAGFMGSPAMNFFPCRIVEEKSRLFVDAGDFKIPLADSMAAVVQSCRAEELIFGIRPEDISCKGYEEKSSDKWAPIAARVNVVETLGKEICLDLSSGHSTITAIVSPNISIKPNETITLLMNRHKIHLFQKETGQAIL